MDAFAVTSSGIGGDSASNQVAPLSSAPSVPNSGNSGRTVKRNRPKRKKKVLSPQEQQTQQQQLIVSDDATKANNKNKTRKKDARRRFQWRKHIPAGTVDPITLESLASLSYPPFALVASEPYDPVPEWPIPMASQAESQLGVEMDGKEDEEERRRRVLEEQWGSRAVGIPTEENGTAEKESNETIVQSEKRHYHLYDGRALAYYAVSSRQFIDPLNRRDLTRQEIVNLDQYLRKHGFSNLSVTEAYDKKGITISTAGAAGNTEAGRAAILQQEATQLLNALFVTPSNRNVEAAANAAPTSRLRAQYQAHASVEPEPTHSRQSIYHEDEGVYGQGGFFVIDDSLNPHLRGSTVTSHAEARTRTSMTNPLWSASHIRSSFRSITPQPVDFPALCQTVGLMHPSDSTATAPLPPKKVAATLSVITKAVKKTDPEEIQRQREAREEALRRAASANLPFGVQPQVQPSSLPPLSSITAGTETLISDAQLKRNMAMAEALGIKAARSDSGEEKAAFVDELISVVYPDLLIIQAKERPGLLLKLEKKWTQLIKDESSSSISLTPMDRPTRVFVHEYSDFWNLQTQSYDPEGKRYIHCRKQLDSRVPQPLLSEAVRSWKGPSPVFARPLPTGPDTRIPLALKPRTTAVEASFTEKPVATGMSISGGATRTMLNDMPDTNNSRVEGLVRERPKLQLQQRSIPSELPPIEAKKEFDIAEELERQKIRAKKELEKTRSRKAREQRALEAAFASDDDGSLDSGGVYHGAW
jgi:hypothetical protein